MKRTFFFYFTAFILLFSLFSSSALAENLSAKKPKNKKKLSQKLEKFPSFPEEGIWLNTSPLEKSFFKEKRTLVYFWDYTSINCIRELSIIKGWVEKYKPYGLQILWIHAPEFAIGQEQENIRKAMSRLGVEGPVFLDSKFELWDELKVKSWPTKFLVDDQGVILFSQVGEGRYLEMEGKIRSELKSLDPSLVLPDILYADDGDLYRPEECGVMTGETYLGYKRSTWWGAKIFSEQWVQENKTLNFKDRGERAERGFFVEGLWTNRDDYLEHARETEQVSDYLGLVYQGREVYVVAHSKGSQNKGRVYVHRDEAPVPEGYRGADLQTDENGETYFVIDEPRLYYLIQGEDSEPHEIKLKTSHKGIAIHSFSFSNLCLSEFEHR